MEEKEEETKLVDGIRVIDNDKPRLAVVRTDPLAIVVLLVFSLILAFGIAFFLTYDSKHSDTQNVIVLPTPSTQPTTTAIVKNTTPLVFARWNFSAVLPSGWVEATSPVDVPSQFTDTMYTYILPNTSCTIAYTEFPKISHNDEYPQTAYATEIIYHTGETGRIERRIAPVFSSTTYAVQPNNAPYVQHEVALSYAPLYYDNGTGDTTRNTWVLFSSNMTPVSAKCHDDFATFIKSFTPHFTKHTLTINDAGLLYIEEHNTGTYLLYRDTHTNIAHIITTLDTGAIYKPTLTDDTLYFVGTNGMLKTLNLFKDTDPSTPSLLIDAGSSVNDFTVATSTITYLYGVWCHSDESLCDLTHATYDMTYATTTIQSEHVTSPTLPMSTSTQQTMSLLFSHGVFTQGPEQFEGNVIARTPIIVLQN